MVAASSNFLLPNPTIIPEFVVFLVVLFVVGWKIVPPINRALVARQRQIAESLTVIDEAKEARAKADERAKQVIEEARAQARTIVDNANKLAAQIESRAREEATEEAARITGRAEAAIDRERSQAAGQLVSQMAGWVVDAAERVLEAEIDSTRHRDLIDRSIAAVAGAGAGLPAPAGAAPAAGAGRGPAAGAGRGPGAGSDARPPAGGGGRPGG